MDALKLNLMELTLISQLFEKKADILIQDTQMKLFLLKILKLIRKEEILPLTHYI